LIILPQTSPLRFPNFLKELFFGPRFYWSGLLCVLFFVLVWQFDGSLVYPQIFFLLVCLLALADLLFLFAPGHRFHCTRLLPPRLSNSDYNPVSLHIWHSYPLPIWADLVEEWPEQFQERKNHRTVKIAANRRTTIRYEIRPVLRGDYAFGHTICLLSSPLGLLQRKLAQSKPQTVKVYPSFLQLRRFQLKAHTAQVQEQGSRQLRKIGHSLEFDHIKEYVRGDDIRAINWKATARKAGLMVNSYVDEKSQQIIAVIDKGRLMKMPFHGLALMDYAINSTLVLAGVALHRQDRFGLITFSHKQGEFLSPERNPAQLKLLQESLYRIQTEYLESDFEKLYLQLRRQVKQRSMILLFTNFESAAGMRRQLPYLRLIARHHLLLVVFFENSELAEIAGQEAATLQKVYKSTLAAKFIHDKKMMVKELMQHGILSLLTSPEQLTVNAVNKYTEFKARQAV
jgi:uncharacterized protein (DUF58 family)